MSAFLPSALLELAVNAADTAIDFILLDGRHMEALFIDPAYRGNGIGRTLVAQAIKRFPNLTTDVNEANLRARTLQSSVSGT